MPGPHGGGPGGPHGGPHGGPGHGHGGPPQVMGHMDMAMEDQIVREGEEEKCVVDASFSNFFNII